MDAHISFDTLLQYVTCRTMRFRNKASSVMQFDTAVFVCRIEGRAYKSINYTGKTHLPAKIKGKSSENVDNWTRIFGLETSNICYSTL